MIRKFFFTIRHRPRLFIAVTLAFLFFLVEAYVGGIRGYSRLLLGWNIFAVSYILLAIQMMVSSEPDQIRLRAIVQSESNLVMMILVLVSVVSCIGSIILELNFVRGLGAQERLVHLILPAFTILSSWLFMHLMFGLQYAHDYYKNQSLHQDPGLDFPGDGQPNYWDFMYAAFIVGTSAQTADVSFTTNHSRKIALIHSVTAFFFNTTLLALTINIAASVI